MKTVLIDAKTGKRTEFDLSSRTWADDKPKRQVRVTPHHQGHSSLVPFVFRLTYHVDRYGDATRSLYFVWKCNAIKYGKRLRRKGYKRQAVEPVDVPGVYDVLD